VTRISKLWNRLRNFVNDALWVPNNVYSNRYLDGSVGVTPHKLAETKTWLVWVVGSYKLYVCCK